jgi:hypothetical protein
VRLSWRARNGRSPGEESRSVRRCGSGDRGAAVLRPDQAIERPGGSRAPNGTLRRRRGGTSNGTRKRRRFLGPRERDLSVQRDGTTMIGAAQTNAHHHRKRLCRPKTLPPTDLSAVRAPRSGSRLAINNRPDRNLRDDVRARSPFLGRAGRREVGRTDWNALSEFGRARSVVHTRGRGAGWHGEDESGHSANERRTDGTNGICPTMRAMAPAIATTMIAPITRDLLC